MVEPLPGLCYIIADCAYTPTVHLVPIYRGDTAKVPRYDNFNFQARLLRIRMEIDSAQYIDPLVKKVTAMYFVLRYFISLYCLVH